MFQTIDFHVIYLSMGIIVSAILIAYASRNLQTRGSRAFIAGCIISIPWMASDMISRSSGTISGQWVGETIRYMCVPALPVALYVFMQQYCGKEVTRRQLAKLLIIPAITWGLLLTNPLHHLVFSEVVVDANNLLVFKFGAYFLFVHLPYSYGILLAGFYTLLKEFSRASSHYRNQIALLLLAMCLPFVVNALGLTGLIGKYTAHTFAVFFSIVGFLIFRYQFLGSNPIAYEAVFQTIRDGVLILDGQDVIRDINPAASAGLGKKPADVIGSHVRDAFSAWPTAVKLYDENPVKLGEIEALVFDSNRYLLIESAPLAKVTGHSEGRIITIRDITERQKQRLSLEEMAFHDPLTRLANRRKFEEEVERAINSENKFAIFYFDLNRFKEVNDTYGHDVGDELLKYVAARVASTLRKPDILARLGGDEFALLIHDCREEGAKLVTERLHDNVSRPFVTGDIKLTAGLSVGTALYPENGISLSELLRYADSKMYQSKQMQMRQFVPEVIEVGARIEM